MLEGAQGNFSIPPTPGSISPEWLTRELRRSGTIQSAKVVSIRVNPVAAGSGFVGQAARLHIEYDRPEPGAPATMFAKLSSADPEVREKLRSMALYETEVGFYEAAFFVPYLEPGMCVLDCGCGPGGISLGLARLLPEGRVIGIDVQENQLEIGRREARDRGLDNLQFKHASVYNLPFEDSTFDAVLAHAMPYHLGDRLKALRELRRVLKPGGLIGVRDSDIGGDVYHPSHPELDRFRKLAEQVISHNGGDPSFGRKHRQILREAGFSEIVGSASCDSYGTPEATANFSKYWTDVFLVQHRELILEQGWATADDLIAMKDVLLSWGGGQNTFYSRCRCEAVGRKPTIRERRLSCSAR